MERCKEIINEIEFCGKNLRMINFLKSKNIIEMHAYLEFKRTSGSIEIPNEINKTFCMELEAFYTNKIRNLAAEFEAL